MRAYKDNAEKLRGERESFLDSANRSLRSSHAASHASNNYAKHCDAESKSAEAHESHARSIEFINLISNFLRVFPCVLAPQYSDSVLVLVYRCGAIRPRTKARGNIRFSATSRGERNATAAFNAFSFLRSTSDASHAQLESILRRIIGLSTPHEFKTQFRATSGSLSGADVLPLIFASSARAPRSLRCERIVNT